MVLHTNKYISNIILLFFFFFKILKNHLLSNYPHLIFTAYCVFVLHFLRTSCCCSLFLFLVCFPHIDWLVFLLKFFCIFVFFVSYIVHDLFFPKACRKYLIQFNFVAHFLCFGCFRCSFFWWLSWFSLLFAALSWKSQTKANKGGQWMSRF